MAYLSCAGMGRLLLDWLPKHRYSIDMFPSNSNVDSSTQSSLLSLLWWAQEFPVTDFTDEAEISEHTACDI